jgi:hypothetical protein
LINKLTTEDLKIMHDFIGGANKVFGQMDADGLTDMMTALAEARNSKALNTKINILNDMLKATKTKDASTWNKCVDILTKEIRIPGLKYFD